METFLVLHTDIWLSTNSQRVIGIASTFKNAIKMAKNDEDAVHDVRARTGHVVINKLIVNKNESDSQVFTTERDFDKHLIFI